MVDFAAWYAGALVVPIYETSSPDQVRWILEDSGASAVVVETAEHFTRVDEVHADLGDVRAVWQLHLGALDKLTAAGEDVGDEEVERRRQLAVSADIATIIYTAGTTGKPKGCVLTHGNFVELSRNAALAIPEVANDRASTLLFITLAHVFARFIAVLCVDAGVRVGHQADTSRLLPALGSFQPTFLLAVPRVFEKVYNSSEQKAEAGGKGNVFRWAADVGVKWSEAKDAGRVPLALKAKYAAADALVFRKLRAALGGRCRWAVSGSAPLGKRLNHFYRAVGMTILEGYGLTETTAPISVNRPSDAKVGTVGPPLPGTAIRITGEGEVEVRGIGVFAGYNGDEQATAETFDGDWFKTGDIGALDDDGHLMITGRKKEIIVTAGGKNVAPAELEDPIPGEPDRQPGRGGRRGAAVHRRPRHPRRRHAARMAEEQGARRLDADRAGRGGARGPGRDPARDRRGEHAGLPGGGRARVPHPDRRLHRGERAADPEAEHQAPRHPRPSREGHRRPLRRGEEDPRGRPGPLGRAPARAHAAVSGTRRLDGPATSPPGGPPERGG